MAGLWGLVSHEMSRLWTRRRLLVVSAGMAVIGGAAIVVDSRGLVSIAGEAMAPTAPMLFFATLDQLAFLFILWPVAVGGTTAEDLSGGLVYLLVPRAGSRGAWMGSKLVAASLSTVLAFCAISAFWLSVAGAVAPWSALGLHDVVLFGRDTVLAQPHLVGLFALAVLCVAGTATAMLSHLIGVLTASPLLSQVGASVLYLAGVLALPPGLNPATRASMLSVQVPWMTPLSCAAYWLGLLALFAGITLLVALRKEAR